jgi:hypothetical protein
MKTRPEHARYFRVALSLLPDRASTLTASVLPGPHLPGRPPPRANLALKGTPPVRSFLLLKQAQYFRIPTTLSLLSTHAFTPNLAPFPQLPSYSLSHIDEASKGPFLIAFCMRVGPLLCVLLRREIH